MGVIRPERVSIDLTFTLPAATITAGDLLADVQALALPNTVGGGPVCLQTMHFRDEDDNALPFDLSVVFCKASTSLGSEDSAFAPSDALARDISFIYTIESDWWVDIGGSKVVSLNNLNIILPTDGASNVYVALYSPNAWVATASGIKASFGFDL